MELVAGSQDEAEIKLILETLGLILIFTHT